MLNTSLVLNAVVHLVLCMLVKVFLGSIFDDLFLKKKKRYAPTGMSFRIKLSIPGFVDESPCCGLDEWCKIFMQWYQLAWEYPNCYVFMSKIFILDWLFLDSL